MAMGRLFGMTLPQSLLQTISGVILVVATIGNGYCFCLFPITDIMCALWIRL